MICWCPKHNLLSTEVSAMAEAVTGFIAVIGAAMAEAVVKVIALTGTAMAEVVGVIAVIGAAMAEAVVGAAIKVLGPVVAASVGVVARTVIQEGYQLCKTDNV